MKRPPLRTLILGHPLVVLPIEIGGCFVLYSCWHNGGGVIPGLFMCAVMAEALRANDAVVTYQRWKVAWDSFDDRPRRRPVGLHTKLGLALAGIWTILTGIAAVANPGQIEAIATAWLAGCVIAFIAPFAFGLLMAFVLWPFCRRGRAENPHHVKVVARCIVPPLPLDVAFAALPEHCQRILERSEGA